MSFELAVREGGVGTKIPMNKVDVGQLPIYKDIKGIYPFYAPTESGKTVIAREFMKHVLQQNDIQMVLCFTPAHRPEWDDLSNECNQRGIAFEYVLKHQLVYCATLMDMQEETFARKGTVGKIVMIWDDQMGAIDMTMAPWHEMCRTMASRARHDEINIVWLEAMLPSRSLPCVPPDSLVSSLSPLRTVLISTKWIASAGTTSLLCLIAKSAFCLLQKPTSKAKNKSFLKHRCINRAALRIYEFQALSVTACSHTEDRPTPYFTGWCKGTKGICV